MSKPKTNHHESCNQFRGLYGQYIDKLSGRTDMERREGRSGIAAAFDGKTNATAFDSDNEILEKYEWYV